MVGNKESRPPQLLFFFFLDSSKFYLPKNAFCGLRRESKISVVPGSYKRCMSWLELEIYCAAISIFFSFDNWVGPRHAMSSLFFPFGSSGWAATSNVCFFYFGSLGWAISNHLEAREYHLKSPYFDRICKSFHLFLWPHKSSWYITC